MSNSWQQNVPANPALVQWRCSEIMAIQQQAQYCLCLQQTSVTAVLLTNASAYLPIGLAVGV